MKKFLIFAAAMLGLVACNNNEPENVVSRKVVLHATVDKPAEGPQRVKPADGFESAAQVDFVWEVDDVVTIKTDAGYYTLTASNINGNQADFEGEVAGSLASYEVYYGYDPSQLNAEMPLQVRCIEGSFRPFISGTGSGSSFTLNNFSPVLKLSLTQADCSTLSYIEFYIHRDKDIDSKYVAYFDFDDDLTIDETTPTVIYLPVLTTLGTEWDNKTMRYFSLKFYDEAGALVMEQSARPNLDNCANQILECPSIHLVRPKYRQIAESDGNWKEGTTIEIICDVENIYGAWESDIVEGCVRFKYLYSNGQYHLLSMYDKFNRTTDEVISGGTLSPVTVTYDGTYKELKITYSTPLFAYNIYFTSLGTSEIDDDEYQFRTYLNQIYNVSYDNFKGSRSKSYCLVNGVKIEDGEN